MSNYYDKRDAKVRIAHELMKMGWKVYGYSPDQSDSMTDYYCPASWDGIAEKNGFLLIIDHSTDGKPYEIKEYNPAGNISFEDREKINKLQQMTQENGATAGEEENAKTLIEKIKEKTSDQPTHKVIGMFPGYMANPGKCIWHIEKDGKIYDKGTGITKYADMPREYEYDIVKMEYTDHYKKVWTRNDENGCRVMEDRELPEKTRKIINDFKALILRFERVVNGMNACGDGTVETEKTGLEQQAKQGYTKIIENVKKKSIKPVLKADQTINVNDVLSFSYHGHYWIVTDIYNNSKGESCVTYELLGSEKRGYQRLSGTSLTGKRYYQKKTRLEKEIQEGKTKVYTLQEVEEIIPTEKWVKIADTKKTTRAKKEQKKEQSETTEQPTQSTELKDYTITADVDTRDNSALWVVKLNNRVDYDEFKRIEKEVMKPIKGYYSRFKGGFIFKYDPTEVLTGNKTEQSEQTQETNTEEKQQNDPYKQPDIKDGFMYDCHFKSWNYDIKTIQNMVDELGISWIDYGDKIGFLQVTAEQARRLKEISDKNQSIFFIDKEEKERKIFPGTININKKLNGIEIKFTEEPDKETEADLKKNGFRYSQFQNLWYAVNTPKNMEKACTITGNPITKYQEAI